MEEGPCMWAEFEYEEAVRKFAAARTDVEAVQTEIASQGSNLEREGRLKRTQQLFAEMDKNLRLKVRAWEDCKKRELGSDEEQ